MIKPFALVIAAGLLAGCGSAPKAAPETQGAAPDKGCYQSDWQAETMPVINKRIGPDRLEKYDSPPKGKEQGCP
ncbi:lipoprotein [Pseudomonas sp. FH4]|jgi:hypothetical protein|uniref:Lipoprotein n=1 Tax=Pseudomonas brenneri TaxID=129817 RepID=A0A5B2V1Q9_9PSED|nr:MULTISPECIES: hypothetical protein [Pseudomonas]KAA6166561.1 hypothetical protein F3K50_26380 [Pseudomonas marginalis]MBU0939011.1 hypothetical protein [Gammaproteobacteria bacterium]MDZ4301840.1 hypothetical protein [Pseudomonas sp.]ETK19557.1 lipoprotein [Pseudomonas sp. FH4]KAA2232884.1 hypothetical protein F1720_04835 [Pseudomonas brenneri]|tara:strand:+ start:124 stop:345 length:222 start_codon:yes stop_codon:yes gene_type:complete